jgi:hypothetical protein
MNSVLHAFVLLITGFAAALMIGGIGTLQATRVEKACIVVAVIATLMGVAASWIYSEKRRKYGVRGGLLAFMFGPKPVDSHSRSIWLWCRVSFISWLLTVMSIGLIVAINRK